MHIIKYLSLLTLISSIIFNLKINGNLLSNDDIYSHAISMHGDIKYKENFKNFDYVNITAPKGGKIKLAERGTFDSLNQFILKGLPAAGLDYLYQSLLKQSLDEPFTAYCLIAEKIKVSENSSSVTFYINPNAEWHDQKPLTAHDVKWTFDTLINEGHPYYKSYFSDVKNAEIINSLTIKFNFNNSTNRELPLIIGQMKILPKHFWENKDFRSPGNIIPIGSGPYKIIKTEAGKTILYEKIQDHWAKNLPVNQGYNNFKHIQYDYYRDSYVMIEALKSGEYDFRHENISKEWATSYEKIQKSSDSFVKEEIDHELPQGMQAFIFNIRKDIFKYINLRMAVNLAFDFEWTNKTLFHNQYTRTKSYFSNSILSSSGVPEGKELDILNKYKNNLPKKIFDEPFKLSANDGTGNIRKNLRSAQQILKNSNYLIIDNKLINQAGKLIEFEILLLAPAFERIVAPFISNLSKLGIESSIRIVDTAQYKNRLDNFDFDIVVMARGQSLTPGNEQRNYWSSTSADIKGSYNWIGIKNKIIDDLIELVIQSPNREELIARTRALDRVLLFNHYLIPHWHIKKWRLVYWDKIKRPQFLPKYGLGFPEIWWHNEKN